MRIISLAANYDSFFVRRDSNATAFAPDLKLRVCVFGFCHVHCSSRVSLAYPVAFESARRSRRCNPPDACKCPTGRSTQVFRADRGFPTPSLRSSANKMGTWHFRQRPRYHRVSALGHREIFNESHFHQKCRSFCYRNSGLYRAITSGPS